MYGSVGFGPIEELWAAERYRQSLRNQLCVWGEGGACCVAPRDRDVGVVRERPKQVVRTCNYEQHLKGEMSPAIKLSWGLLLYSQESGKPLVSMPVVQFKNVRGPA